MTTRIHHVARFALALSITLATVGTAAAQQRFVPVTEGMMDSQTGLVWGYSYSELTFQEFEASGAGTVGWLGPYTFTWSAAVNGGVPEYESLSNSLFNRNDSWRLPTIDEVQAAADAGLFHQYLYDYNVSLQRSYWSATTDKKNGSSKGKIRNAEFYDLLFGDATFYAPVPINSYNADFIPVHPAD